MVRGTLRALPWAAAISGFTAAAWAFLRLRGPCPHGDGQCDPEPDPLIMTDDVREAIADAMDAEHEASSPDGGTRMAALRDSYHPLGSGFSGCLRRLKVQPGPEYIDRGVHVSVRDVAARETAELFPMAVTRRDVPALGARLRSVGGVHCDDRPSGAFSLGGKCSQQDPPSRVSN